MRRLVKVDVVPGPIPMAKLTYEGLRPKMVAIPTVASIHSEMKESFEETEFVTIYSLAHLESLKSKLSS